MCIHYTTQLGFSPSEDRLLTTKPRETWILCSTQSLPRMLLTDPVAASACIMWEPTTAGLCSWEPRKWLRCTHKGTHCSSCTKHRLSKKQWPLPLRDYAKESERLDSLPWDNELKLTHSRHWSPIGALFGSADNAYWRVFTWAYTVLWSWIKPLS